MYVYFIASAQWSDMASRDHRVLRERASLTVPPFELTTEFHSRSPAEFVYDTDAVIPHAMEID